VLNADVLTEKQGAAGQGYATQVSELAGKSAKRTLIKGEAIPLSALRSPVLVMQGKSVLLKAEGEGFSVSLTATAMESGAQGETIRVRNPESGVIVSGVVGADGTVMASAP
jgi:flagella basal body P-ring formation protein FlgA